MISEEKIIKDFFDTFNEVVQMTTDFKTRNILTTQAGDWIVDTAEVCDRDWKFETAIANKDYNNGEWIIVGKSDTRDNCVEVHKAWDEYLHKEPYPQLVADIYSGELFSKK